MLKEKRLEEILSLLSKNGSVEINQLCSLFNVTNTTVRRDLEELELAGKIRRTHGGAILSNDLVLVEPTFNVRIRENADKKRAIGTRAATLLSDGQKVFVSSGSTSFLLACALNNTQRLLVVTDAINIANELATKSNITTIMLGGEVRGNTLSVTGSLTESMIRRFNVDIAFLGVTAIGADGSLYQGSMAETGLFNELTSISKRIVILADSSKIGHEDFIRIGHLKAGYTLITNNDAGADILKTYRDAGVETILA